MLLRARAGGCWTRTCVRQYLSSFGGPAAACPALLRGAGQAGARRPVLPDAFDAHASFW